MTHLNKNSAHFFESDFRFTNLGYLFQYYDLEWAHIFCKAKEKIKG